MTGKRLSGRAVSLVATQAAMKSRIESHVVEVLTSQLKLPFRLLSRGANALSFVQLVGAAVDLFTAIVYDPYEKYEHYVSDRVLRAMAHAELVATQRLTGRQRVTLDPFEWMANTRFLNPVKDASYDMLLGMMYTRARRVNSEGSLVYWYAPPPPPQGDDDGDKRIGGGDQILSEPRRATSVDDDRPRATEIDVVISDSVNSTTTSSSFLWFAVTIVFFISVGVFVHLLFLSKSGERNWWYRGGGGSGSGGTRRDVRNRQRHTETVSRTWRPGTAV
jgi:hypothetical protein